MGLSAASVIDSNQVAMRQVHRHDDRKNKTCLSSAPRQVLSNREKSKLEGQVDPKLHTPPAINHSSHYSGISNINKRCAVARRLRQTLTVENIECIPLEVEMGTLRDGE